MKKLLFLAVSALIAGASFCSAVGNKVVAKVSDSDSKLDQQKSQLLVLEKAADDHDMLTWHSSHSSHSSHGSHGSHGSHSSHSSHSSHFSGWG